MAIDIYLVTNPHNSQSRAERFFIDNLTARMENAPDGYFVYP